MAALERVDVQLHERIRVVSGDLLDVHAALRREHEQRLLRATVEREREVVLVPDVGRALDQSLATVCPRMSMPRIVCPRLGLVGCARELDPARLATSSDEHLRLDDDGTAERLGRGRASAGVVARTPSDTGIP